MLCFRSHFYRIFSELDGCHDLISIFVIIVLLRLIPKRRFVQNHFEHTEKEVRPKRRFGTPKFERKFNPRMISLKWHILASSPLFENSISALSLKQKEQQINLNFKNFNLLPQKRKRNQIFTISNIQISKYQKIIISNVSKSKMHFYNFQLSNETSSNTSNTQHFEIH